MPYKINVPYAEKDLAKSKGAFWDNESKTWYIPDHKDLNDFLKWIDTKSVSIIARAPLYLGINHSTCWKCGSAIKVIALYSGNFYQLDLDREEDEEDFFEKAETKSFFHNVTYLDNDIVSFLSGEFPFFRLGFSRTVGGKYWANHCEKCNALQGDFFNHNEPGGAFFPMSDEEYRDITLVQLPFKYDVGINGSFSWSSDEDAIFKLATKKKWEDIKSS